MEILEEFINEANEPIKKLCLKYIYEFKRGIPSHPGKQKKLNGLRLHTVQVIKKALELNQVFDRKEIIETCLVHDLRHWKKFPLNECQKTAIMATKGLRWEEWRLTKCYKFVTLILIADMWSAYLNDKNL